MLRCFVLLLILSFFPIPCFAEENPCPSQNNFQQLSEFFIKRLENISLEEETPCTKSLAGVIFRSTKDVLEVYPEKGYTFFVKDDAGEVRILSWDLHWALLYSLKEKAWYFHEISPQDIVHIRTLKIKKDTLYNPREYEKLK